MFGRNVLKIGQFALKILKEGETYMHDDTGNIIFPTQYQIIHLCICYRPETIYSLSSQLRKAMQWSWKLESKSYLWATNIKGTFLAI
jgi:hypothetical protein